MAKRSHSTPDPRLRAHGRQQNHPEQKKKPRKKEIEENISARGRVATPIAGDASTTIAAAAAVPRSPPAPDAGGGLAAEAPVLIFVYFHKAIRAELERMHAAAVRLATERSGDVAALDARCRFLFSLYRHHCDAEDAVRTVAPRCMYVYGPSDTAGS
jgi:hypothetical protein